MAGNVQLWVFTPAGLFPAKVLSHVCIEIGRTEFTEVIVLVTAVTGGKKRNSN